MLAQVYAVAGDFETAIEWLSLAVERGFINYPYLADHDPLLTRMTGHPEYRRLLEEVRGRWNNFAA